MVTRHAQGGRCIIGAWHAVVHVRTGHRLTVIVEHHVFEQCLPDALNDATMHLTFHHHGIADDTKVINRNKAHHVNLAGICIDLDFTDVRARREVEIRRIEEGSFLQTGFDLTGRKMMGGVGRECHLAEAQPVVGAGAEKFSVLEGDAVGRYLQQMCGDLLRLDDDLVTRQGDG